MKIKELYPNIYYFDYKRQYDVTMGFIRLQEFYESPYKEINGKYFTLEKYMDIYSKNMGNFTYCSDWSGFNVPGNIVRKFVNVFMKDLRDKEKKILNEIEHQIKGENKFYIIAGYKNSVINHEVAHGLFYVNKQYKKEMLVLIDNTPKNLINRAYKALKKLGYSKNFFNDEIQAYFSESKECVSPISTLEYKKNDEKYIKKFREVFKKYYEQKNSK